MNRLSSGAVMAVLLALGGCTVSDDGASNGSAEATAETAPASETPSGDSSSGATLTTNSVVPIDVDANVADGGASLDSGNTSASVETDGDVSATAKTDER